MLATYRASCDQLAGRHFSLRSIFEPQDTDAASLEGFLRSLVRSRELLETTSCADLVRSLCTGAEARRLLFAEVVGIDHIGFIAPANAMRPALSEVAMAAGYGLAHQFFPSMIVCRELAALRGKEVPTSVFM